MVTEAITGLLGASMNKPPKERPKRSEMPTALTLLPAIQDKKLAKIMVKEADKERLIWALTQPEVIGLLMTIAGIYASQKITFSRDKLVNEGLQAASTSASVLIGLGHAGLGDMTTAIVAGLAGLTSLLDNVDFNAPDSGDWWKFLFPFGGLWSILD